MINHKIISKHIEYEIDMMLYAFEQHLKQSKDNTIESLQKKVSLESFLIHLRNLYEFLFKDKKSNTDVNYTAFLDDPTDWKKYKDDINKNYNIYYNKIHKHLAHITTNRQDIYKRNLTKAYINLLFVVVDGLISFLKLKHINYHGQNLSNQLKKLQDFNNRYQYLRTYNCEDESSTGLLSTYDESDIKKNNAARE